MPATDFANGFAALPREMWRILRDSEVERRLTALEETAEDLKGNSEPWRK
jgi:hypothetical protein